MSAYVPADLRRRVREHFFECCAYCLTAENLSVATFEVEHIIPRAAGGPTVLANVCLACPSCNRFKRDRITAVDPITQSEVPLFHPQRDAWAEHFAWSAEATEIVPLTAIGRATLALLRMNRPQLMRVRRLWVTMGEHPPQQG